VLAEERRRFDRGALAIDQEGRGGLKAAAEVGVLRGLEELAGPDVLLLHEGGGRVEGQAGDAGLLELGGQIVQSHLHVVRDHQPFAEHRRFDVARIRINDQAVYRPAS